MRGDSDLFYPLATFLILCSLTYDVYQSVFMFQLGEVIEGYIKMFDACAALQLCVCGPWKSVFQSIQSLERTRIALLCVQGWEGGVVVHWSLCYRSHLVWLPAPSIACFPDHSVWGKIVHEHTQYCAPVK